MTELENAVLNVMKAFHHCKELKTNKVNVWCRVANFLPYTTFYDFNKSTAARILTDVRKSINRDGEYYIVADNGGWYLRAKYEDIEVLDARIESLKKSLVIAQHDKKKFILNNQVRSDEIGFKF